jgi:hypothetical protein
MAGIAGENDLAERLIWGGDGEEQKAMEAWDSLADTCDAILTCCGVKERFRKRSLRVVES